MIKTQDQYAGRPRSRDENTPRNNHYYPPTFPSNNCHENLVYVMPSDSVESAAEEPITKNAGSRWREDETEALVDIWRDKICQTRWWKQSKGVRVNKEMWEDIAQLLAEREVFRTASQCQIRMKNLLQYYRQTIDNKRAEKSWEELPEYFDIVDNIMSRREANGSLSDENSVDESENRSRGLQHHPYPMENEQTQMNEAIEESTSAVAHKEDKNKATVEDAIARENRKRPHDNVATPNVTVPATRYGPYYHNYLRQVTPQYHGNCYTNKDGYTQPHWGVSRNQCCDMATPNKQACNGTDMYSHIMPIDSTIKQRNQTYPLKPYLDSRPNNFDSTGYHTQGNCSTHCTPNNTKNEYHYGNTNDQHTQQKTKTNPAISVVEIMQEFMQLQYKQMENLLEVEKKRLEIEERRLQEEKDVGNRNAAFLMEAVKILAQTFRNGTDTKKEYKNEKLDNK